MSIERENSINDPESDEIFDNRVSKNTTHRVWRLIIDVLKTSFQAFLVGFVVTPFVLSKFSGGIFTAGLGICLTLLILAVSIEIRMGGEK